MSKVIFEELHNRIDEFENEEIEKDEIIGIFRENIERLKIINSQEEIEIKNSYDFSDLFEKVKELEEEIKRYKQEKEDLVIIIQDALSILNDADIHEEFVDNVRKKLNPDRDGL